MTKADLVPIDSSNLNEPPGEWFVIGRQLAEAVERMLRATTNGHPIGHDAVVMARRALKRAEGTGILGRPVNLQCNCTPCARKRRWNPLASDADCWQMVDAIVKSADRDVLLILCSGRWKAYIEEREGIVLGDGADSDRRRAIVLACLRAAGVEV